MQPTVKFIAARNTIKTLVNDSGMDPQRAENIFALLHEMTEDHASTIAQLQIAKKMLHSCKAI